ncbi:ribonuclease E/G [Hyphomonas johnsonii]|uniref:RNA-binding protein AU-1/Ribonuclease E/G domain-containing protein n=1 Tax=Hyphomonas johnsonii MHS-2 TaxID=1280950 RepID=A0A059FUY6_9PROT|nr:ribonuclease E/G [Hyphomonas johnsonii]KCZ94331.1 hypothetical protein HJO_03115 [Hyphomonas johnsonii MHS-2]
MPVVRILREAAIAETRWVALDETGRPVALRLERLSDRDTRASCGDVLDARIRKIDIRQGGGFAELSRGGEAFVRLSDGHGLTEGAAVSVRVVTEARRNKLPRVELARDARQSASAADRWVSALPGGGSAKVDDVACGDPEVAAAFDEALTSQVTLTGGGLLTIEPTTALVAADIDTAGRSDSGRAAARALRINLQAAQAFARQLSLRNLGGAGVLDCVSPINRDAGIQVKEAFLSALSNVSHRTARALPPSAFGLLEVSVAWGETPIADRLHDRDGRPTAETLCLDGLRDLQREALAQPMATLTLGLPAPAHAWMQASGLDLQRRLDEKFGARLRVTPHEKDRPEVFQS